jgi:hypothetical protein
VIVSGPPAARRRLTDDQLVANLMIALVMIVSDVDNILPTFARRERRLRSGFSDTRERSSGRWRPITMRPVLCGIRTIASPLRWATGCLDWLNLGMRRRYQLDRSRRSRIRPMRAQGGTWVQTWGH